MRAPPVTCTAPPRVHTHRPPPSSRREKLVMRVGMCRAHAGHHRLALDQHASRSVLAPVAMWQSTRVGAGSLRKTSGNPAHPHPENPLLSSRGALATRGGLATQRDSPPPFVFPKAAERAPKKARVCRPPGGRHSLSCPPRSSAFLSPQNLTPGAWVRLVGAEGSEPLTVVKARAG